MMFLAGIAAKALSILARVPWYVYALVLCGLALAWERHELVATAAELANARHNIVAWRSVNATNAQSVRVLIGAVTAGNLAVTAYAAAMAKAAHAAATAKAAAAAAALGRDHAISLLDAAAAAAPPAGDCAVPAVHLQVMGQL